MKIEIIFEIPDNENFRMVCQFGYDSIIDFAWYGHLQQKTEVKKYLFFGKKITKWVEIDQCWWSFKIESVEHLKKCALKFYDEKFILLKRLLQEAMDLK